MIILLIYTIGISIAEWQYYKESTHTIATKVFVGLDTTIISFSTLFFMLGVGPLMLGIDPSQQ